MEDTVVIKCCLLVSIIANLDALKTYRDHFVCDYNYFFDKHRDSCLECPLGSFGVNCTQQCKSGFYGRLCTSSCECESQFCHSVYGCQKGTTEGRQQSTDVSAQSGTFSGTATTRKESSQNKTTLQTTVFDFLTYIHVQRTTKSKRTDWPIYAYSTKSGDVTKNLKFSSSEKPYQVTLRSTSNSGSSKIPKQNDHWMLTSLILIALISAVFIGGVLIYLRPSCQYTCAIFDPCHSEHQKLDHTSVNIQETNEIIQDTETPESVHSGRLENYDEIIQDTETPESLHSGRLENDDEIPHSQFHQQADQCSSTIAGASRCAIMRKTDDVLSDGCLQKHSLYEKISFHFDYNVLQFKKKESVACPDYFLGRTGNTGYGQEEHEFLRSSRSLDSPVTTEDSKSHNLSPILDISLSNGERDTKPSSYLVRSNSESQLVNLYPVTNSNENNTIATEEDCFCNDFPEDEDRPYSVVHIRKSKQENLLKKFHFHEQPENITDVETTKL